MLKVGIWVCQDDDSSSQVYRSLIFVALTRGNVTLHNAIGPFVKMTFESRPSCGKIGLFVGFDYEIGPFVGIGPVVGIGLFGETGPFVSLTYIIYMMGLRQRQGNLRHISSLFPKDSLYFFYFVNPRLTLTLQPLGDHFAT